MTFLHKVLFSVQITAAAAIAGQIKDGRPETLLVWAAAIMMAIGASHWLPDAPKPQEPTQ